MRRLARYLLTMLLIGAAMAGCVEWPGIAPENPMVSQPTAKPTAGGRIASLEEREVPPALGVMFDWGDTDYQALTGVPTMAVMFVTWEQVSPGPGQYNWGTLDRFLDRYRSQTVTLMDGRVIPKPVIVQLHFYLSSAPNWAYGFYDATPQWVYNDVPYQTLGGRRVGYVLETCGRQTALPRYDDANWRARYLEAARAFAAHVADEPQVVGAVISVGLDGETQPCKDQPGCPWMSEVVKLAGVEYRWKQFVDASITAAGEMYAGTDMRVWLDNTPTRADRITRAQKAHAAGLWLKHAGGVPDNDCALGLGDWAGTGSWEYMRDDAATAMSAWESAYDIGDAESKYWSLYAMLGVGRPGALDVHTGYLPNVDPAARPVDSAFLRWVVGWLGHTAETSPGAWIVLRDAEGDPVSRCSWWPGDFGYFMQRTSSDAPRVWRSSLPADDGTYPGRQCRRIAGELALDVDNAVYLDPVEARLSVTILNYGEDTFSLGYTDTGGDWVWGSYVKGPSLGPVGHWVTVTLPIYKASTLGDENIRILSNGDGAEYVHKVEVRSTIDDPATPTATRTIETKTPTATILPTQTEKPFTLTPTPTRTPGITVVAPTWTALPTYTPYPTWTPPPTLTLDQQADALIEAAAEQGRVWSIIEVIR